MGNGGIGGRLGSEKRWIEHVFDPWAKFDKQFNAEDTDDAGVLRKKMHNQNISEIIKKISEGKIHAVGLQELDGMSEINGKSLLTINHPEQQLLTYAGIPNNVIVSYFKIPAAETATEGAVDVGFVFSRYSFTDPHDVKIYTGILFNSEQLEFDKSSENTFFTMDHTIQPGRPLVAIKVKYKEKYKEEDIVLASMHGANFASPENEREDYFRQIVPPNTDVVESNKFGQDQAEKMHDGIVAQIKQMEKKLGKQPKYIIMGDMNDEFPTIEYQEYDKDEGTVKTVGDTSHATKHGWPFKSILSILANDGGLKYTAKPSDKGTCCLNWNSFRYDLLAPEIFGIKGGKRRKPKRRKTKGKKTKGKKTKRRKTKGRKTSR